MSEACTIDAQTSQPAQSTPRNPIWPKVVIVFGLGLTIGWTILLGYGITKLIEMVI